MTIDHHKKAATKLLGANETAHGKSRSVYGMLDKSARANASSRGKSAAEAGGNHSSGDKSVN